MPGGHAAPAPLPPAVASLAVLAFVVIQEAPKTPHLHGSSLASGGKKSGTSEEKSEQRVRYE